jgi:hypothetical protein
MSRQNKVNPGMYTQRGRLTPDDAAREMKKQREIGSENTWQPSKKDHFPRLASDENDAELGAETSGDNDSADAKPSAVNAKPAPRTAKAAAPKKAAPAKAKRSKTAKSKTAMKTAGKAKAAKPAAKRGATKTVRKAVLARNVGGLRLRSGQPRAESRGGGGPKPRKTAKRRKS